MKGTTTVLAEQPFGTYSSLMQALMVYDIDLFHSVEKAMRVYGEQFNETIKREYPRYRTIKCADRMPPIMSFVPVIDEAGEIAVYRLTEHGWNMRYGMADNSPNNNVKIIYWLEKY